MRVCDLEPTQIYCNHIHLHIVALGSSVLHIFGHSPSAIIVIRPETYLRFLKLPAGNERILHKVAVRDLDQRSLGF